MVKQVLAGKTTYDFVLQSEGRNLPPVVIKGERSRFNIRGDTVSYDVLAFSSPQDRVIEDVLKKMPGIQVDDKGKISYNGRAITNFYLDGDNLLDDKYAIGTKNIPNKVVDKVQVMENHQPVKALSGKAFTEQVDINITFRDSAKLRPISQARIGAGLPDNYDEMLSTMLFKGKYKSINYFKTNNTGTDLA